MEEYSFEDLARAGAKPEADDGEISFDELSAGGAVPLKDEPGRQRYSAGQSFALGGAQGATLGFFDELAGAYGKAAPSWAGGVGRRIEPGEGASPEMRADYAAQPTNYQLVRDGVRRSTDRAREDNGKSFFAGELLGGVAVPLPGGAAKSVGQAVKQGAKIGAAYGLGTSDADLTEGELGRAALDTGLGAAFGGAGGAAGHGVQKLGREAARFAGFEDLFNRKIGRASSDAEARGAKEAEEIFNSAHGKYRQTVADAYRQGVERPGAVLPDMPPELQKRWSELSQSGRLQALKEKLFETSIDAVPGAIQKMDDARAAIPNKAELTSELSDEILNKPWKREMLPRIQRYAAPVLGTLAGSTAGSDIARGVVGAGAGFLIGGGKEGNASDAAIGALAGAGARPALRSFSRMLSSPSVRKMWWTTLQKAAEGGSDVLGKYTQAFAREMQEHGVDGALALDEALTSEDPEYAALKSKAVQEQLNRPGGGAQP